jgi:uncharacterized protein
MDSQIIDIFTHVLPRSYFDLLEKRGVADKRWEATPALYDIEKRLEFMNEFPGYAQVLVPTVPPIETLGTPKETPELAKFANNAMAELIAKHPDRFLAGAATLPLNNIEASLKEIDRSIKDLGLKGIQIHTDINGLALDNTEFRPIFEKMAEYDLPIWLHPIRSAKFPDYTTEKQSKFQVWFCFGWPYATAAAMTHIIFTGLFDKYPNLKIITHHLGGVVPYFANRIKGTYDQYGSRAPRGEEDVTKRLKKHPVEYFKMFYADTSINCFTPAMECGLAFFGADRVLFGTDMPYDVEGGRKYIRETIRSMGVMRASLEDKTKIYRGNARNILKLDHS